MTIALQEQKLTFSRTYLEECAQVIDKSGAHTFIDFYRRQAKGIGGRTATGPRYSIFAVLTIGLALIGTQRAPSMAEIWRTLWDLDSDTQQRLGLDLHGYSGEGTYRAFAMWLTRYLEPLDSLPDIRARRDKNGAHRQTMAARTEEQQQASVVASERLHQVVNAIVAGSIDDPSPSGYKGDVVADETIIDLAGQSQGLGSRDDKQRGAAYSGAFYIRDREDHSLHAEAGSRRITKGGVGLGVTAVSRVGPPQAVYDIPSVITAISIDKPSSGSVMSLERALRFHQENGFDQRTKRGRIPFLTVDMGYNVKRQFSDVVLDAGYAPIVRYPISWRTIMASDAPGTTDMSSGPVQIAGDFYCPMARHLAGDGKITRRTVDLLDEPDGFEQHDAQMEALFPLLMGTNSRPYRKRATRGRPSKQEVEGDLPVKIDLVCPAVQGRVKCPLKPASMVSAENGAPTVAPSWDATRYRCCSSSSITQTYTPEQWKRAQWGLVPGSWEHTAYYESARAITEQRFSIMKSHYVTGMDNLRRGVRREPMLYITIALWIAATNRAIQDSYARRLPSEDSMKKRLRMIEEDLGRTPVKAPPRT